MFELANRLVGIYKTFNCTKCVALSLENVDAAAEAESAANDDPLVNGELPNSNNNNVVPPTATAAKIAASQPQTSPKLPTQAQPASGDEEMREES